MHDLLIYTGDDLRVQELDGFIRHQLDDLDDYGVLFRPEAVEDKRYGD